MKSIGVRELRQNASKHLETVASGEVIEITDRGRPVARLVPITGDTWRDLVAAGEVTEAVERLDVHGLRPSEYEHSASAHLNELRTHER